MTRNELLPSPAIQLAELSLEIERRRRLLRVLRESRDIANLIRSADDGRRILAANEDTIARLIAERELLTLEL